jgi:hypothetical protein
MVVAVKLWVLAMAATNLVLSAAFEYHPRPRS